MAIPYSMAGPIGGGSGGGGSGGGGATSVTGTANQITASPTTGAVILSTPQSIHTAATPTFGGLTLTPGPITVTQGTLTADAQALSSTATWNNAAVAFTGTKLNITDTASAAASLLMDLQIGGISKFKVNKSGQLTLGGGGSGSGALDMSGATSGTLTQTVPAVVNAGGTYTFTWPAAPTASGILTTTGAGVSSWSSALLYNDATATVHINSPATSLCSPKCTAILGNTLSSSVADLQIINNSGNGLFLAAFGSAYGGTRYGTSQNKMALVEQAEAGPLAIGTSGAFPLIFGRNGVEVGRFNAGELIVTSAATTNAYIGLTTATGFGSEGFKFYFDGAVTSSTFFDNYYDSGDIVFRTKVSTTALEVMRLQETGYASFGLNLTTSPSANTFGQVVIFPPDDAVAAALAIRQPNAVTYGFDFLLDTSATTNMTLSRVVAGTRTTIITFPNGSNNLTFSGVLTTAGHNSADGSAGVTVVTCSNFKNGLCVAGT